MQDHQHPLHRARWPLAACALALLALADPVMASQSTLPTLHGVTPDATVGQGPDSLRPTVLDPVTGAPWVEGPYRVTVFRHATQDAVLDLEGTTDAEGHTAHLRVAAGTQPGDVMASPVIGHGPLEAKLQITRRSGKVAPHQGYVMYFGNGAAFTGLTDAGGNTAVVRFPGQTDVTMKLRYLPHAGAWQQQAQLLNSTVTAPDVAARLAIYQRLLQAAPPAGGAESDVLPAAALVDGMLVSAAQTSASALARAVPQYVAIMSTPEADTYRAGESAAQRRFGAWLDLLDRLTSLPNASAALVDGATADALKPLRDVAASDRPRSHILDTSERLVDAGFEPAAFRLFDQSGLLDRARADANPNPRTLAFAALEASARHDTAHSLRWMSDANVAALLADDSKGHTDALAFYRKRVLQPPAGMLAVDREVLALARSLCVKQDNHTPGMFQFVSTEAAQDNGLRQLRLMQAIDALLSSGTLAPGSYAVDRSSCTDAVHSATTVTLQQSVVEGIRDAHQLFSVALYFGPSPDAAHGSGNAAPPVAADKGAGGTPTALEIMAFLQHAAIKPGTYPIHKLREAAATPIRLMMIDDPRACGHRVCAKPLPSGSIDTAKPRRGV